MDYKYKILLNVLYPWRDTELGDYSKEDTKLFLTGKVGMLTRSNQYALHRREDEGRMGAAK